MISILLNGMLAEKGRQGPPGYKGWTGPPTAAGMQETVG